MGVGDGSALDWARTQRWNQDGVSKCERVYIFDDIPSNIETSFKVN